MPQLLGSRLRPRAAKHRHHRRRNAGRAGRLPPLVAVEGPHGLRLVEGRAAPGTGARPARPDGRGGRAARGARLWRRLLPAAELHPVPALPQRACRRRHHPQLADVGDPPGAVRERHRARREGRFARTQQRRLRPGMLARRADRRLPVRHRRRLHRHQERAQRRRPPARHPEREHRHPQLRDEGRPRRRHHRQRDLRRRPPHLRRALPHGQPAPGPACCG